MTKYLLEIGTEELPYTFIPSALEQLKNHFSAALKENRLEFENIKTYSTPRRLCVIIEGLSQSQPDLEREIKGPPARIAFDDKGELTQAGLGFAKKQGLSPDVLEKKTMGNEDYLWACVKEDGKPTKDVLQAIVPELILKLQGARFMRWGDFDAKFSRPIRWMVSLLDKEEVKLQIENVVSGKESWGHRFSTPNRVNIKNADTYLDDLYSVKVIADTDKRRAEIEKQIHKVAEAKGGIAKIDPELLKEVTNLVEWPTPVVGNFDAKYLEVTQDVIVSVLAYHQRYFPIYDKQGKLLNYFITIANHDETNIENIQKGNEKVVTARLDDAIFFYREDTKKPLETKVDELKGVTFQKGLGTMHDKMQRIQQIAGFIADELGLDAGAKEKIQRTALLCKADLVTNLVREFTELQGIIGTDYAALTNEDELVAQGIKEHYMPVSADGELAETVTGQVVGLADKIDTICGVFALGKAPTGSADPLGLRRASLGIINTLLNKNLHVDLVKILEKAVEIQPIESEKTADIPSFIVQRFRVLLNEKYKHDVVDAVLEAKNPLIDVEDVLERAEILAELVKKDSYKQFHESANRIPRIIKGQTVTGAPDTALFADESERKLWEKVCNIAENKNYPELVRQLEEAIPSIEAFFDNVLVMDKDEKVKQNRLNLLAELNRKFLQLADFSKIVF